LSSTVGVDIRSLGLFALLLLLARSQGVITAVFTGATALDDDDDDDVKEGDEDDHDDDLDDDVRQRQVLMAGPSVLFALLLLLARSQGVIAAVFTGATALLLSNPVAAALSPAQTDALGKG
jgi:hypothetical protein